MSAATTPLESRNPALDGARGLAIVLVLVCHGLSYPAPGFAAVGFLKTLATFTFGGVELFCPFRIPDRTVLLRTRRALNQAAVFYLRRACRILPVYALLLASYFLMRDNATLDTASGGLYFRATVPLWTYFVFCKIMPWVPCIKSARGKFVITWSLAIEEEQFMP